MGTILVTVSEYLSVGGPESRKNWRWILLCKSTTTAQELLPRQLVIQVLDTLLGKSTWRSLKNLLKNFSRGTLVTAAYPTMLALTHEHIIWSLSSGLNSGVHKTYGLSPLNQIRDFPEEIFWIFVQYIRSPINVYWMDE